MKFSYALIKKLVPGIKSKSQLIEALNLHSFETEDAKGDTFEASIPSNRFSDASSHLGLAREARAILNILPSSEEKKILDFRISFAKKPSRIKISIKEKDLCRRYAAGYFSLNKIRSTPVWMKKILEACGLRSVNPIVDIMNFVMLETGQPLHAFDAGKIKGAISVRKAKKGEKFEAIDGGQFVLGENALVIADEEKALAIAGIKGGRNSSVDKDTQNIIVEAANFRGDAVYKSSRQLGLPTDAALRFSHNINPGLVELGLARAGVLLQELARAEAKEFAELYWEKPSRKIVEFDLEKAKRLLGIPLDLKTAKEYLNRLGCKILKDSKQGFLVEPHFLRDDLEIPEDLIEEVVRLYGYDRIKPQAPSVAVKPVETENELVLSDNVRQILSGMGFSEVYNYSFVSRKEKGVALENPVSEQFALLRPDLVPGLKANIKDNLRYVDSVRIFELGRVFSEGAKSFSESLHLGLAVGFKALKDSPVLELKGVLDEFCRRIGLVDYLFRDQKKELVIESEQKALGKIISLSQTSAVAEIDLGELLELVSGEREFRPLPKYPSVMRDISVLVSKEERIGSVIQAIQESDLKYIYDVDLLDEYESEILGGNLQSLTFRIVFQAEDRTLTDEEVDKEMEKVVKMLKERFNAGIR